jgi:anti-sigma regulatory factor (Ser/Thr protein kinase)
MLLPTQHQPPARFRVPATLDAVPRARRRVRAAAGRWGAALGEDAVADLELLAGEVIANAVTHTGAGCEVSVTWTGTRARVEVTDQERYGPRRTAAGLDSETGRGVQIVAALAADWGCRRHGHGKTVWFEIAPTPATAPPATSPAACA